jgi:acetolactate decarboxylase
MRILILFSLLALASCTSAPSYEVSQHGGMRDALRMGNTQPRITFAEVSSRPHAIAVGALPNLAGEITVFDGTIYTATTADGQTAVTVASDATFDSATLLSLSYVDAWQECSLPSNHPLEEAIELSAVIQGIDTESPFPFFITGTTSNYHLHVINGYCPVAKPDLEAKFQPWRKTGTSRTPITVVGFYAKNQEGVMTHHGSNVHIHGILDIDGSLTSGHLDSVEIDSGAILFFPAQ